MEVNIARSGYRFKSTEGGCSQHSAQSSSAAWLLSTFLGYGQDSPGHAWGGHYGISRGGSTPRLVRQNRTARCLSEKAGSDCTQLCRIPAWGAFWQKKRRGRTWQREQAALQTPQRKRTQTVGAVHAHPQECHGRRSGPQHRAPRSRRCACLQMVDGGHGALPALCKNSLRSRHSPPPSSLPCSGNHARAAKPDRALHPSLTKDAVACHYRTS